MNTEWLAGARAKRKQRSNQTIEVCTEDSEKGTGSG
jgi:hypothetical protein